MRGLLHWFGWANIVGSIAVAFSGGWLIEDGNTVEGAIVALSAFSIFLCGVQIVLETRPRP